MVVIVSAPAGAYPSPNEAPQNTSISPAAFLPAPNPSPYCPSSDYFGFWSSNKAIVDAGIAGTAEQIDVDTASTEDDGQGIVATFTTTTRDLYGGPQVEYTNADIGIVMYPGGEADISLSEPLFYSQWVFTDLDLNNEGFAAVPQWSSTENQLAVFGPHTQWDYTGTSSTEAHFINQRTQATKGYDLQARAQVDFFGAIDGLSVARSGTGGSGVAAGAGCKALGVSQEAAPPVWNENLGAFEIDYTVRVVNNLPTTSTINSVLSAAQASNPASVVVGTPTQIDETQLQVANPLDLAGFASATVTSISSADLAVNADYDGSADTNLLAGTDTLAAQESGVVYLTVAYTPDYGETEWTNCSNQLTVQAQASALASSVPVSDRSDDGTNPLPAELNGSGGSNDPTTTTMDVTCEISLTSEVSNGPVDNGDGSYTVEYTYEVLNAGISPLAEPRINNGLASTFGPILDSVTIGTDTCSDAVLDRGETCTQVAEVIFTPTELTTWTNSPSVMATAAGLTPVNGVDTASFTLPAPQVDLNVEVTKGPTLSRDGTYKFTLVTEATNTGEVSLTNVVLDDDLADRFGSGLISAEETANTCSGGSLAGSATCSRTVVVTVAPGADLGLHDIEVSVAADGVDQPVSASATTSVNLMEAPSIDITSSIFGSPVRNPDGTYTVNYQVDVTNTGNVNLANTAVLNDLVATFGADADVTVSHLGSTRPGVINTGFDGVVDADMTVPFTLKAGENVMFQLQLILTEGALTDFENIVTTSGISPAGTTVNDQASTEWSLEDAVVTPVDEDPQIDLTSTIVGDPVRNEDGTYSVNYKMVVTNTGKVELADVTVLDNLAATFGLDASVGIDAFTSSLPGITNPAFDGITNLVMTQPFELPVGASVELDLSLTVSKGALDRFENNVTTSGISPKGVTVTDEASTEWVPEDAVDVSNPDTRNDTSTDNVPGTPVTIDPLANDADGLDPASVVLFDPVTNQWSTEVTVAGQGTWTVEPGSGRVTFTPVSGFTGNPTPIRYRAWSSSQARWQSAEIVITYKSSGPDLAFTGSSTGIALVGLLFILTGLAVAFVARRGRWLLELRS